MLLEDERSWDTEWQAVRTHSGGAGPLTVVSAQRQADRLSDSSTRKDVTNLNFKKETEKPSRVLKTGCQITSLEKHMGVGA